MKKIIKSKKISNIFFFIMGAIIFGSIGVFATNYLLKAEDVEYVDKDNNSMTVQNAITDLYNKASSGGYGELILGTATAGGDSITVPFDNGYIGTGCVYGIGSNYDKVGKIVDNNCVMEGLSASTTYNYKVGAIDASMKFYVGEGTKQTEAITYLENPIEVYFNPVSGKCSSSDYSEANSVTGVSTGCMKWYAYKTDGSTYTMLLDHNTYAEGSYEDAMSELETLQNTNGWKDLNTTTLSFDEVKMIVKQPTMTKETLDGEYVFDNNCKSSKQCNARENKYAWLFSYLANCENYGCYKKDGSTQGYYLIDAPQYYGSRNMVWSIVNVGRLSQCVPASYIGLRPVITVPASVIAIG